MLFLSYHENASCSASPIESDLESDATSLPTDVGCMRRSCGYPDLRNNFIGNNPALRIRGNSCSASLAQERVALYLSKVLVAFNLTFEMLPKPISKTLVTPECVCRESRKRSLDSRLRRAGMTYVPGTAFLRSVLRKIVCYSANAAEAAMILRAPAFFSPSAHD